jgi:hypothetical protein
MEVQLRISVISVDWDDEVYFEVEANNSNCGSSLLFYGEVDEFVQFGNNLVSFPNSISDRVIYESGSSETYNHLLIEAYCYDPNGHTAFRITMRNGSIEPQSYSAEFSITLEAAGINNLGRKLASWDVKNQRVLTCFKY